MLKLLVACSLLSSSVTYAGTVYQHSGDTLQKLYAELHYLHEVGLEIHQKYDETDPIDMKACSSEYGFISTRAKATIGIANRLESPNKKEYIETGWQAYECIRCTGNVASCDVIPPTLKVIEKEFYSDRDSEHD